MVIRLLKLFISKRRSYFTIEKVFCRLSSAIMLTNMINKIKELQSQALTQIQSASDESALKQIELKYLSRKSDLNNFAKQISSVKPEERKEFGMTVNIAKKEIENAIELKLADFNKQKLDIIKDTEWKDLSVDQISEKEGARHPISKFLENAVEVFARLGFSQAVGPEIETEWYNFTALNVHPDHPAREMQDTFFIKDLLAEKNEQSNDNRDRGYVLRTQTSSMQIHYMQNNEAPIRIIAPGKTFRKDSDATHSPMFHQIEGLMVDKNISLRNLKAVLLTAIEKMLEVENLQIRFRLSYFPFVEPGLEVDIAFKVKDKLKWFEVAGAGMVHPNVLKNGGFDPEEYNGFAFGFGADRLAMIKHNITDIRALFENDVRFLRQF